MGAFVSVGVEVSECQPEDSFVRFSVKPTQRASAQDLLRDWKKTRKGKVPGQSTEGSSKQKRAVNISRGKAKDRERQLLSKELEPVDSEDRSANARG